MRPGPRGSSDDPPLTEAPLTLDELLQSSADSALLAYLSTAVSMLALFAFVSWQAMQPTVVESARVEGAFSRNVAAPLLTAHGFSENAERLAAETADQENGRQQSQDLDASGTVGMRVAEVPIVGAAPVRQSKKPRQVVRSGVRDVGPAYSDSSHSSWSKAWDRNARDRNAWDRNEWDRNRSWSYDRRGRGRNDRAWNW
jgi:hypothetical protein